VLARGEDESTVVQRDDRAGDVVRTPGERDGQSTAFAREAHDRGGAGVAERTGDERVGAGAEGGRTEFVRHVDDSLNPVTNQVAQLRDPRGIEGSQQRDRFIDVAVGCDELVLA